MSKLNLICILTEAEVLKSPWLFLNISLTVVIHTSMEKSSQMLQLGNRKIGFSFQKRSKFNFYFYFDLCRNAGNHPRYVNTVSVLQ